MPWALATPEGLPRKTNKAALAAQLQKNEHLVQRIPENAATITDALGLVQKINVASSQNTFGSVASTFFTMALNKGGPQRTRIDIVFNTYREISITNVEWYQRGGSRGAISKHHCYTDNPTVEEISQSNEEQDQLDSISCK